MKSPTTKLLLALAAVVLFTTVTAIAGAQGTPGQAVPSGCVPDPCPPGPGPPGPPSLQLEYGAAAVDVTRGAANPATFATYSTALGSPVVDTTGGTFRFTCNAAQAPCFVAVKAAALSDTSGTVLFYPRILIERTGTPTAGVQPTLYCEYADGSSGGGLATLTKQPKAALPAYEAVEVNIGGSADCFPASGPGGDVARIEVPEGFYNVDASFAFRQ